MWVISLAVLDTDCIMIILLRLKDFLYVAIWPVVWKQPVVNTLSNKSSECSVTKLYTKYMGSRTRVVKIGQNVR